MTGEKGIETVCLTVPSCVTYHLAKCRLGSAKAFPARQPAIDKQDVRTALLKNRSSTVRQVISTRALPSG